MNTYHRASNIFSRALGFIYMIAFASFALQARGLIGAEGILPANTYLRLAYNQLGAAAWWRVPSIFWWAQSDYSLLSIAWGGVALAAISIIARPHSGWQRGIFVILFVYYLSIVSAGQVFMSFQWDLLLLETGFLAIFLTPALPRIMLFRWLLFRLMLGSGLVKLLSHDPTWRDLTALSFHYETQPLPTVLAWYAHQLPRWFQQASTVGVFLIELTLPVMIFGPRRFRQIAAFGFIALQVLIFATGNYNFFNLLTIALCVFLFDDEFFRLPAQAAAKESRRLSIALAALILTLSSIQIGSMIGIPLTPLRPVADAAAPFGIVNEYGLFAVMTTQRPELEIEGSNDGRLWLPYVFPYKPGPLTRAPGWAAPFQPRLDWQMWFAALSNFRQNPWLVRTLVALLQGSKPVQKLFLYDPFGGKAPRQIRVMVYDYHFTTPEERHRTGRWWKREEKGLYLPALSLQQ